MTPQERRATSKQIRVIRDAVGLKDWVINWQLGGTSAGRLAEVECVYGRRIADITLCDHWLHLPPSERVHTITHELIHVVLDQGKTYLRETLPTMIGMPAWNAIDEATRQYEEHAVDQLAVALSPFMPVIEA